MVNLQNALDNSKKPRKKYRVSNVFVDTYLHYRFPLAFASWEAAVEHAVRTMTNGREGIFVLLTNRPMTPLEALTTYRSRNAVETALRDQKNGIDWRPARCTSPDAIRGRVLISFLALFCMSKEDGEELISGLGGVEVVWIYKDGRIEYTEGVKDLIVEKS